MTAICLQLGSAASTHYPSDARVITATTPEELTASRQGISQSSLDQLDVVVAASDLGGLYNPMELANWVPFMCADATSTVSIKVVGEAANLQPVHTSFLLVGLPSALERREADGSRVLTASRKVSAAVSAAPLKKTNAVTLSLDDDDMIDEDNLLSDDVLAPPPAMGARSEGDDCSGRKACDNCSCGRADAEASSKPTNAPSSSCGKCSLGDAFRCASCPYLGKPAFKAGEEHLILQLSDDL